MSSPNAITAPMIGRVVKVMVKPGDEVASGTVLMVIESMKMETDIESPVDGKIKSVGFGEGVAFKEGDLLIDFE